MNEGFSTPISKERVKLGLRHLGILRALMIVSKVRLSGKASDKTKMESLPGLAPVIITRSRQWRREGFWRPGAMSCLSPLQFVAPPGGHPSSDLFSLIG
jgi:hypothetical protein